MINLKRIICLFRGHRLGWSPKGYNYWTKQEDEDKIKCMRCWGDFTKTHVGGWGGSGHLKVVIKKREKK